MKKLAGRNKTLCLKYCHYFKPGKNEKLVCRGHEIVERLIQRGFSIDAAAPGRDFNRSRAEPLVQRMCSSCDFRKDGCDFMLDRLAPPCGGFVLLARLAETGMITVEDI
jgi:hypothetical protein